MKKYKLKIFPSHGSYLKNVPVGKWTEVNPTYFLDYKFVDWKEIKISWVNNPEYAGTIDEDDVLLKNLDTYFYQYELIEVEEPQL